MTESRRIIALDLARTAALVAMAIYHFTYDLSQFGWIPPGTATQGGWAIFARVIASSFLFLAGVSLWLAHGQGIRWRAFLRRAAQIGAGALAVTIGTRLVFGESYVFFGILHSILVSSTIGLLFLRLPGLVTLAAGIGVILARPYLAAEPFNAPWLLWLGLSPEGVRSVDYVPLFPWLGPLLIGLALAKLARGRVTDTVRTAITPGRWINTLAWPGRHSLAIYLLHQPVLFGAVYGWTMLVR